MRLFNRNFFCKYAALPVKRENNKILEGNYFFFKIQVLDFSKSFPQWKRDKL